MLRRPWGLHDWHGFRVYLWNVPLPIAGVYLITNLSNGKQYVGSSTNVLERLQAHRYRVMTGEKKTALAHAFRKYGFCNFLLEPVFYTDDRKIVGSVEDALIDAYDTLAPRGYNQYSAQILSEEHRENMRIARITSPAWQACHTTPAQLEKRSKDFKAIWARPGYREARSIEIRETWANPQLREEQSARLKTYLSTPDGYAQRLAQIIEVNGRPEVRAKHAANSSNLRWINNGNSNSRISSEKPLPEGWVYGRVIKGKPMGPLPGTISFKWINDGVTNRHLEHGVALPAGWSYGKAKWYSKQ